MTADLGKLLTRQGLCLALQRHYQEQTG
jgi:hypothetical protein